LPHAVVEGRDGVLGLNYQAASIVSAVTAAKEIVALKRENKELKQRLADIESKLATI
jgi:predicted  nucleic acid-binding Zn-ribbon protein